MNRLALVSGAAVLALAAGSLLSVPDARSAPESAAWTADVVHSHILFKVKHLETSWSWGRFNDFSASVETDDAANELTAVAFTVKAESVDTGDEKRDQHLRSPDFLNVKEFPTLSFKSTSVKAAGTGTWDVTGDLSLHGETKPVTARVAKVGTGTHPKSGEPLSGWEATFSLKRSDFGVKYGIPSVGDDIQVIVAVEAARK